LLLSSLPQIQSMLLDGSPVDAKLSRAASAWATLLPQVAAAMADTSLADQQDWASLEPLTARVRELLEEQDVDSASVAMLMLKGKVREGGSTGGCMAGVVACACECACACACACQRVYVYVCV
jgi:hypothetical protein